ncbi:TadE/TadG family protein [Mesorhizobium tamadayense]|uniref:TadE/TadG family protein n=1 Tax=Mesorhizobium tamadayense TaxID=425306 RepID=A0A3P3F043_9HYPH|nr:pilus assembly protein [Mesorhizobium tamadayense]RRH92004.1 TadE/TadG family protein [Mesorhizobium tamadayense]
MVRRFLGDRRGNFALLTVITMVPLMGAVALAVDYTELVREKQETLNALDAAGIAAAQQIVSGASDTDTKAFAKNFFEANLTHVSPADTLLNVTLPNSGGTLKLCAHLHYHPYFLPAAAMLIGKTASDTNFTACSEVRLKNTLEVALVLDNSGSMDETGFGTSKKRLTVLKDFAKGLIDLVAAQARTISQLNEPVQFALVPFAASVNVGPDYYYDPTKRADWLDLQGLSPIHHENFNWKSFPQTTTSTCSDASDKCVQSLNGMWIARGNNWGTQKDQPLTRFTLFEQTKYRINSTTTAPLTKWGGCIESRPYPCNIDDTQPNAGNPATLFVPMFAPDEAGEAWTTSAIASNQLNLFNAPNSWWNDDTSQTGAAKARQMNMTKYFKLRPANKSTPSGKGPNYSCTTTPITPLTDVTVDAQRDALKTAIVSMVANGATNVPEAMAWGWRVLSSSPPFTKGRSEAERGNDKVIIVLTDGANTYYTPGSLRLSDDASNQSTYSAYGYASTDYDGQPGVKRIFKGTTGSVSYDNSSYTAAMNQHFVRDSKSVSTVCQNAVDHNLIVMTIALDLNENDTTEKKQIQALKDCASESRFTSGKKLFWNTRSDEMEEVKKEIADELSNLRIVS